MRRQVLYLRSECDGADRVLVESRGSRYRVELGERSDDFDVERLPDGRLSLLFSDGRQICGRGRATRDGGVEVVRAGNAAFVPIARIRRVTVGRSSESSEGGVEQVRALMHGRVIEVRVAAGERVESGSLLLVLEAMKMQNEIRASLSGTVERLEVTAGQTVEGGVLLLSIQSDSN
jgi:biotin carboxyl carrier protein